MMPRTKKRKVTSTKISKPSHLLSPQRPSHVALKRPEHPEAADTTRKKVKTAIRGLGRWGYLTPRQATRPTLSIPVLPSTSSSSSSSSPATTTPLNEENIIP